MKQEPEILVGIMIDNEIDFEFSGTYFLEEKRLSSHLKYRVKLKKDSICLFLNDKQISQKRELLFTSNESDSSFLLKDVTIGIDFHWEQKENQSFKGGLKFIIENDKIRAINIVHLEEYLRSVISSEMSATSSPELLKAHAVISRSWLLAQIEKNKRLANKSDGYQSTIQIEEELIRWYDREDHEHFDVCADDHCQRYQGITKIINTKALEAIDSTLGQVMVSDDQICDTRFSKCCGGISENFEKTWEPTRYSYLTKIVDSELAATTCVDLRQEDEAEEWIKSTPPAFCNTNNKQVLSQVLPDFDQATSDFYRWKVSYSQEELSSLIFKKIGIDFGQIIKLEAVERGHSSRIIKLKITGTKKILTIGKELEIRRALSESHLYSSAFVVDHIDKVDEIPQKFVLSGAGWGHGVGLCQIGAAVMGEKGYSYKAILKHYFNGAELENIY